MSSHDNRARVAQAEGLALQAQGKLLEAEQLLRESVRLVPESAAYQNNLGSLLGQFHKHREAEAALRRAVELNPRYAKARANLATLLLALGRPREAAIEARTAAELAPNLPDAHVALGIAHSQLGKPFAALRALELSLQLEPLSRSATTRCAQLLGELGRQDAADDLMLNYVRHVFDHPVAHSNFLYGRHHIIGNDGEGCRKEHEEWSERYARALSGDVRPHANVADPNRRLRVGYVSADFRDHPAARFLIPIIQHHDRSQVEVVCYNDTAEPDQITAMARNAADLWRDTTMLNDQALDEQIRRDAIDVLIEPTGHMAHNRLLTFARQPAPVQIAYFGYPGTIALPAVKYRITDRLLDPPGQTEDHYTEELLRVGPSAMAWAPLTRTPEVKTEPPAERNGFVTFGALNRLSKVTPHVISLWGKLLANVPRSRLMILSPAVGEPEANREICDLFARHGVSPDRLDIAHRASREKYLELFHHIDVHLDPFPYHGCTTTCDALWMGVPTVTLAGKAYAARMGVSLLSQVGLSDLIATSPEQYVQTAKRLALGIPSLRLLRQTLRSRMLRSPLMDYKALAQNFEATFRVLWREWCEVKE